MNIVSVNVGLPREVNWKGDVITTGIFKSPVNGPVTVRTLGIEGDGQADLTVHGGITKAVYLYPAEHYSFWRDELPEMTLSWGYFGENLTTNGLLEDEVAIGDIFRMGTALLQVTEPRMPCFKLGIRFGRSDIVKRFLVSQRSGIYFSVLEEGGIKAGDTITSVERHPDGLCVADITRLYAFDREDWDTMRRAVALQTLPQRWRDYFQEKLEAAEQ